MFEQPCLNDTAKLLQTDAGAFALTEAKCFSNMFMSRMLNISDDMNLKLLIALACIF